MKWSVLGKGEELALCSSGLPRRGVVVSVTLVSRAAPRNDGGIFIIGGG
jgi:hypothetical protein